MKIFLGLVLATAFISTGFGQQKTLLADGTLEPPVKNARQPMVEKLSAAETAAVKKEALATEIAFDSDRQAMSSEESNFKNDFELLDAADGFFIARRIRFRAYLYTAYSRKMRRHYQGIIVLKMFGKRPEFEVAAHYVYEFRGDRHLRQLPDINGNQLSELAIYAEPPTKKEYRKDFRMIEFSPDGLKKLGGRVIYSSIPQKQRFPRSADKSKPVKRVYTPPKVEAIKLYAVKKSGKLLEFYEESWRRQNDFWDRMDKLPPRPTEPDEDKTNYLELRKPSFPAGAKLRIETEKPYSDYPFKMPIVKK